MVSLQISVQPSGVAAGFLVFFAFMMLVGLAAFVWWLVRLIEVVRLPENTWLAAGQSRVVAVLLMIFLGLLGTIIYTFAMRPDLKRVGALAP